VIAEHLQAISPIAVIRKLSESIVRQSVLQQLRTRDLIFACTDNHWSRAVLNRFAHQYLVPTVDMGIRLDARTGEVSAVGGQVTLVGAGLSCLRCSRLIDPERVRVESLPEAERHDLMREGYIQGMDDPEPSIISLNTTVAGMAVTAGVSLFTKLLGGPPPLQLRYDAQRGSVFAVEPRHDPGCDVCSDSDGVKGLGDLQPVTAYE
jgi:molybdopterin-synthase adenylyltransferase